MEKEKTLTTSIYRKVAIDIAKNIANGKYTEGQKLFGRSVLASQYKVSPETIRKAVHILKSMDILDVEKGSGIEVVSVKKAIEFVESYNNIETISETKNEVLIWAKKQVKETSEIVKKIQSIIDVAERFSNVNPFIPFEIKITNESIILGKTQEEVKFWENTGGTIIAINRGGTLIISPGPCATFFENDIFYMIGSDQSYVAAKKIIFG